MIRLLKAFNITLDTEQINKLAEHVKPGISRALLIRQAIEDYLNKLEEKK